VNAGNTIALAGVLIAGMALAQPVVMLRLQSHRDREARIHSDRRELYIHPFEILAPLTVAPRTDYSDSDDPYIGLSFEVDNAVAAAKLLGPTIARARLLAGEPVVGALVAVYGAARRWDYLAMEHAQNGTNEYSTAFTTDAAAVIARVRDLSLAAESAMRRDLGVPAAT
jgi:hypothetical protein